MIFSNSTSEIYYLLSKMINCYDIFIYGLDLNEVIYSIISRLINEEYLKIENLQNVLTNYYDFLKYYNNNYRPIYHLECFFFKMIMQLEN